MLPVQERNAVNQPDVTFTRGLDLSKSTSGAGGIGGLLARYDHTSVRGTLYHCDLGGNITALFSSNQVWARYSYDPYGNMQGSVGPLAEANRYRFSSKELHGNSGLIYYGYRFYDPNLQRWVNRDPIQERGGIHLYEFAKNSPIRFVDTDGRLIWLLPALEFGAPLATAIGQASLAAAGLLAAWWAGDTISNAWNDDDEVHEPRPRKPEFRPAPKPKDCPPRTKPIDQAGLDKGKPHEIKEWADQGPTDWTGIDPEGNIITGGGPNGGHINWGPFPDLNYPGH